MPEKPLFYGSKVIKWSLILFVVGLLILLAICLAADRYGKQKSKMNEYERELWEEAVSVGSEVAAKIIRLYEEKREEIEEYSEQMFALWDYAGPTEEAEENYAASLYVEPPYLLLSRHPQSTEYKLQFYDFSFQSQECEWDCPEELEAFFDVLWLEYEIQRIYLTTEFISFEISEDRLTYYLEEYRTGFHEDSLDDHWSHFWFPYGI